MKRILLIVLLSLLIAAPHHLTAAEPAGTMVLNKGAVKIRRTGIDTLFQQTGQQIPVFDLDEIQTGNDANVTITLTAREETKPAEEEKNEHDAEKPADTADLFAETTARITEEIETIQEELVETATEKTIEIRITHE
jgi:hypothetical protein